MDLVAKKEELKKQVTEIEEKEKVLKQKKKKLKAKIKGIDEKIEALEREEKNITNEKLVSIVSDLLGDVSSQNLSEVERVLRAKLSD